MSVNGDFVREGTFLAMAPGFPGVSSPLDPELCQQHRLVVSPWSQRIYAATRGPSPQVLQFAPKGTYGYGVALPIPGGPCEIADLGIRKSKYGEELLIAVTSPMGTRLLILKAANMGHGIQEWHVIKFPNPVELEVPGFFASKLAVSPDGESLVVFGDEEYRLFDVRGNSLTEVRRERIGPSVGRLFGISTEGFSWCDPKANWKTASWHGPLVQERLCPTPLPAPVSLVAASCEGAIVALENGEIFAWGSGGFAFLGSVELAPIHALCQLSDQRIFAFAGPDIAHWYVLPPSQTQARDLGVAVSTLSSRRYGFQFGDLQQGVDGEIYAAESDRGGHLWIYFPPLLGS
jgi:hypothetical protein